MMIDPSIEPLLTLREAARLPQLCRNGRKPHLASVYRWVTRGVHGIVLESVVIAGSRCTTSESVNCWIAALTARANGDLVSTSNATRTPIRRQRDHERANSELERAGW